MFFIGLTLGFKLQTPVQTVTLDTNRIRADFMAECFRYVTDNVILLNETGRELKRNMAAQAEGLRSLQVKMDGCSQSQLTR